MIILDGCFHIPPWSQGHTNEGIEAADYLLTDKKVMKYLWKENSHCIKSTPSMKRDRNQLGSSLNH